MSVRQLSHFEHKPEGIKFPLVFMLNDVTDPKNVGAIFRLADAMGVEFIYLCGATPIPPHKLIKKTARSCECHIPWIYFENEREAIEYLKNKKYILTALELTNNSEELFSVSFEIFFPLCLIVGNENHGVSEYCLNHAKKTVHIPMMGNNSSMNVSMALGMASYEIVRQYHKLYN